MSYSYVILLNFINTFNYISFILGLISFSVTIALVFITYTENIKYKQYIKYSVITFILCILYSVFVPSKEQILELLK